MVETPIPDEVTALAEERVQARLERDWARADALRDRIESAGWRVVDDGPSYHLYLASTPDEDDGGRTIYGSVASVPSRLDEPATTDVTVVLITGSQDVDPRPALGALAEHGPAGTQVVVVAPRGVGVSGPHDELVQTVEPFTAGDALQAALRRSTGAIIVVLDPARVPTGDVVTTLAHALADPSVAIAGSDGLESHDLHRFTAAGGAEPATVAPGCYAFRREEVIARGPVDDRLRLDRSVAIWLGLLLRDAGEALPPRRALVVELPLVPASAPSEPAEDARAARRDGYRIADRFHGHAWLTGELPPERRQIGDRAEQDHGDDDAQQADDAGEA